MGFVRFGDTEFEFNSRCYYITKLDYTSLTEGALNWRIVIFIAIISNSLFTITKENLV
jgi:hypothetical protein